MANVRQLLEQKGKQVWTVSPDASVLDALRLMGDKNIGAVPVVDQERLVGIFSERDFARSVAAHPCSPETILVRDVMTPRVFFVDPDKTIEWCMSVMTEKHIRHLPVLDHDRLVGIISIGDVVKEVVSDQAFIIEHLESYITGSR